MANLHLDKSRGVFGGVLAGFAKQLDIDPVILRIVYLLLFFGIGIFDWFFTPSGLILFYIICWMVIPRGE